MGSNRFGVLSVKKNTLKTSVSTMKHFIPNIYSKYVFTIGVYRVLKIFVNTIKTKKTRKGK